MNDHHNHNHNNDNNHNNTVHYRKRRVLVRYGVFRTIPIEPIPREYYPDCFYTLPEVLQSRRQQLHELRAADAARHDDDDDSDHSNSSDTSETANSSILFTVADITGNTNNDNNREAPTWRGLEIYRTFDDHNDKTPKQRNTEKIQHHVRHVAAAWKHHADPETVRRAAKASSRDDRVRAQQLGRADQAQVFGTCAPSSSRRRHKHPTTKKTARRSLTQRASHKLSKTWKKLGGSSSHPPIGTI